MCLSDKKSGVYLAVEERENQLLIASYVRIRINQCAEINEKNIDSQLLVS